MVVISEKERLRRTGIEKLRTTKWLAMMKDWEQVKDQKRTRNRIRKGVPDMVRGTVWNLLGSVKQLIEQNSGKYEGELRRLYNDGLITARRFEPR